MVLVPKIPEESLCNEENITKRISISTSIEGCVKGCIKRQDIETDTLILVYELEISENDEALTSWRTLYEKGMVMDAPLTREYWYMKPIIPERVRRCRIEDVIVDKHILIDKKKQERAEEILGDLIVYDRDGAFQEKTIVEIINELPENTKILFKERMGHFEKEDVNLEICEKLFGTKPREEKWEEDYHEYEYVAECRIVEKEKPRAKVVFKHIGYAELQMLIEDGTLELGTWKLIDKNYVREDVPLLIAQDQSGKAIAYLYYYITPNGEIMMSAFEVYKEYRGKGLGKRVIEHFCREYRLDKKSIFVEPISKRAERFWRACGISCYFPDGEE